jgi:hypothetical protein
MRGFVGKKQVVGPLYNVTGQISPCTLTLFHFEDYESVSKTFRTESIKKPTPTISNTRWETTQSVTATNLTRLTYKIAIQLHLVTESCTICSSRSRRPVRKLLDIWGGYTKFGLLTGRNCGKNTSQRYPDSRTLRASDTWAHYYKLLLQAQLIM